MIRLPGGMTDTEESDVTDCIEIRLVANAGVLVRGQHAGVLVDGLHHEDGHPFGKVSPSDMERMRSGAAPFDRLDYLLFTHEHPDHFTPGMVLDHIARRPAKGVFLPRPVAGSSSLALLLKALHDRGIPSWPLSLDPGEMRVMQPEPGLRITAIGTRHMGPQFQDVPNDCFLVEMDGANLLFTGDADPVEDYYAGALGDAPLDAVFVNPIFYHSPQGQGVINDIFRPREVVIYHLPPKDADPMHLHFSVQRALEKYGRPDVRTRVLDPGSARSSTASVFLIPLKEALP